MSQTTQGPIVVISGTGLYTPQESISNAELVESFNRYVDLFNEENKAAIEAGELEALSHSSEEFIVKASGIESRYVMNKSGVLDPTRLCPSLPERSDEEPSIQCEIAVAAAKEAMAQANKTADDIDAVIVACSNMQRPYPAMAIEVQQALGIKGYGFDMNVACSSATFGLQTAKDAVLAGSARSVLVLNPEICSGHLAWEDRDCHFIFGDVCTAAVVERLETSTSSENWEILGSRLQTQFSNNIRNNFGFLNRCDENGIGARDKLFRQNGRKVFKEVVPMVAEMIVSHLSDESIETPQLKRMWLHQANLSMNLLISKKVLGRDASVEEAPVILNEYANTSSAGSVIAFHKYRQDFTAGEVGVICSFGAGYSAGSVIVRKR
ncbi:MAG: beta-ketoacyl-ACP synthase III [Pseudomonadota bacterium]|nr:beta-ketoacyl-ACP synthase III [Pseudomonadota bacterium]